MTTQPAAYPLSLDVDAPAPQGRLGVFFRIILLIPHLVALWFVILVLEILTFLAWFAILITGRYPASFAGFAAGALRWNTRVNGYGALLTGRYPPFSLDEQPEYPVRVGVEVALEGRSRLLLFVRWLLVLPHLVVLGILGVVGYVVLFLAWIIALITGSVPAGLHSFLAGVQRYSLRVTGYAFLLTDRYPPFGLS